MVDPSQHVNRVEGIADISDGVLRVERLRVEAEDE
jgi:hypothetical protein